MGMSPLNGVTSMDDDWRLRLGQWQPSFPPTQKGQSHWKSFTIISKRGRAGECLASYPRVHGFKFRLYETRENELFSWDVQAQLVGKSHFLLWFYEIINIISRGHGHFSPRQEAERHGHTDGRSICLQFYLQVQVGVEKQLKCWRTASVHDCCWP